MWQEDVRMGSPGWWWKYREMSQHGGKRTKSEIEGVGEEEFAPWTIGPVL